MNQNKPQHWWQCYNCYQVRNYRYGPYEKDSLVYADIKICPGCQHYRSFHYVGCAATYEEAKIIQKESREAKKVLKEMEKL